jgi:hypothetical protein
MPPVPPVLVAVANPLPTLLAVLVVALALPPAPPLPPLKPRLGLPAPPLPPFPPVAFAVLLASVFGGVIALAAPPGPPSVPGAPTPLMPAVPTTFKVMASTGSAKTEPKVATDAKIANFRKAFVFIIEAPQPDGLASKRNLRSMAILPARKTFPMSQMGQTRKYSRRSAVGTVIADRPPPKSVQAEFPHTAPTLGA